MKLNKEETRGAYKCPKRRQDNEWFFYLKQPGELDHQIHSFLKEETC